jgi:hypothetical protein
MGDIFSAIGILLVFATVVLDFFVKDSQTFLQKTKPDSAKTKELKNYINERNSIGYKLTGVLIFYLVLFWLLIPKTVEILKTSTFDIWDFNLISTFYVLINLCILIFIVLTSRFLIMTIKK